MKKIAVILSGCGFLDGTEITESVSTLIALSELKADYEVFAPQMALEEIDHYTQKPTGSKRDVLTESARIARGNVKALSELKVKQFDGLALPGGYGAAKNLSNWAQAGSQARVRDDIAQVILDFHQAGKPICAICIAPTLIAKTLGSKHVTLTIGSDRETAQEIHKTGAEHVACAVDDFVTDRINKIVTTPAYMYDAKPFEVFTGIRKAIQELVEMA